MSPIRGHPRGMENTMNFAFSEEQDELRTAVRRFLEDKSPETEVRRLMETTDGYDKAVWAQMADQPLGVRRIGIQLRGGDRRARRDGSRAAVRSVLLHRRPRGQRPAHVG